MNLIRKIFILLILILTVKLSFSQSTESKILIPGIIIITDYELTPCDTLPRQVTISIFDSNNNPVVYPTYFVLDGQDSNYYFAPITLPIDTGWHSLYISGFGAIIHGSFFIDCGYASVQQNEKNNQAYLIYPIPTHDIITIEDCTQTKESLVTIYNIYGQILLQQKLTKNKTVIDISRFTKGVYFVKLNNSNKPDIIKFMKE